MKNPATTKDEKTCNHRLKCIHCQKEFSPLNKTKKYCSDLCRTKNFYEQKTTSITMVINIFKEEKKGFLRRLLSLIW